MTNCDYFHFICFPSIYFQFGKFSNIPFIQFTQGYSQHQKRFVKRKPPGYQIHNITTTTETRTCDCVYTYVEYKIQNKKKLFKHRNMINDVNIIVSILIFLLLSPTCYQQYTYLKYFRLETYSFPLHLHP